MTVFFSFSKFNRKNSMAEKDLYSFSKRVYYLLSGKIGIIETLDIVARGYNEFQKNKILQVKKEIEKGIELRKAFSIIIDDKESLEMLNIAGNTGKIEEIFKSIYEKYEFKRKLKGEIRNLSIYPVVVILTAFVIIGILLKFVVPKFKAIYEDLGRELPSITKVILKISEFLNNHTLLIIIILTVIGYITKKYSEKNKKKIEKMILNIRFLGILYREINVLNFSKNMHTLLNSGVLLSESLKLTENTKSLILSEEIKKITKKIEKGEDINKAFKNCMFFDKEYISFLVVGEKTGNMTFIFENLTKIYTEKVEEKTRTFLKILEPLSILIIGSIIGIIIFSVMLPMFNMGELIQ